MTAFFMNEATFDLPDDFGFVDRTLTQLAVPAPGGDIALLIERRPFPVGKSLEDVAREHGRGAAQGLRGHEVISERQIEVVSLAEGELPSASRRAAPAIDVSARWRTKEGEPIYAHRIHLAMGSTWLVMECCARLVERERCDAIVNDLLASLELRA